MNIKLDENLGSLRIAGLEAANVTGKLWIIRQGSIQEYQDIKVEIKDK